MVCGMSRRELLFRKLPKAAAALASSSIMLGFAGKVLAEPIQKNGLRSDEFVNHLLIQHCERILNLKADRYSEFCSDYGFDRNNEIINHGFVATLFLYELIRKKGILNNRYMLIDDRPEGILKVQDGEVVPLEGDELKLRSPKRMLKDMFSGKPRYRLPDGSKVFCFGDCDEYEMAYVTLLRAVGIEARIVMTEANHVKTQVELAGRNILIDNTRNQYGQSVDCEDHCKDYRTGKQGFMNPGDARRYLRRINRMANARSNVRIYPKGEKRVDRRIKRTLDNWEKRSRISANQESSVQGPNSQTGHTPEEVTEESKGF